MSYDYQNPRGTGDVFYQYVFDAGIAGLVNASAYQKLFIPVDNYDFILRQITGQNTIVNSTAGSGLQVYDSINRGFYQLPPNWGSFAQSIPVLPEKRYPVNSRLAFDLYNVLKQTAGGSTFSSQLVFSGVRRIPGAQSDPADSDYTYYLKRFMYPYSLTVNALATAANPRTSYTIDITDYDFELDRVEMTPYSAVSPFSIVLYDTNKIARSNLPVNANRFFHFDPSLSSGEMNFWPTPPLLYKVNSRIQFDITSLLLAGAPATYQLLFHGHRRIPCK